MFVSTLVRWILPHDCVTAVFIKRECTWQPAVSSLNQLFTDLHLLLIHTIDACFHNHPPSTSRKDSVISSLWSWWRQTWLTHTCPLLRCTINSQYTDMTCASWISCWQTTVKVQRLIILTYAAWHPWLLTARILTANRECEYFRLISVTICLWCTCKIWHYINSVDFIDNNVLDKGTSIGLCCWLTLMKQTLNFQELGSSLTLCGSQQYNFVFLSLWHNLHYVKMAKHVLKYLYYIVAICLVNITYYNILSQSIIYEHQLQTYTVLFSVPYSGLANCPLDFLLWR